MRQFGYWPYGFAPLGRTGAKERAGSTMTGTKAITAEQKKIHELQALLRQKDRDIEILKKASVLLLLDSKDHSL
ncbi:hypothetical protein [Pseudomonas orientalis]|uniref:hypothetical protein n=1 Tax=Pseudomonas orientalis TaxID=76758 RepID=UPI0039885F0C